MSIQLAMKLLTVSIEGTVGDKIHKNSHLAASAVSSEDCLSGAMSAAAIAALLFKQVSCQTMTVDLHMFLVMVIHWAMHFIRLSFILTFHLDPCEHRRRFESWTN